MKKRVLLTVLSSALAAWVFMFVATLLFSVNIVQADDPRPLAFSGDETSGLLAPQVISDTQIRRLSPTSNFGGAVAFAIQYASADITCGPDGDSISALIQTTLPVTWTNVSAVTYTGEVFNGGSPTAVIGFYGTPDYDFTTVTWNDAGYTAGAVPATWTNTGFTSSAPLAPGSYSATDAGGGGLDAYAASQLINNAGDGVLSLAMRYVSGCEPDGNTSIFFRSNESGTVPPVVDPTAITLHGTYSTVETSNSVAYLWLFAGLILVTVLAIGKVKKNEN